METLEELTEQLASLHDLNTIVRTMKALSAARIRQYEHAVEALSGYDRTVTLGLRGALFDLPAAPAPRPAPAGARRSALVAFGSDHGLCGRFNEDVTGQAAAVSERPADLVLAVGLRLAESLRHAGIGVDEELSVPASAPQITTTVQRVLFQIDEWRAHGGLAQVSLIYNTTAPDSGEESATYGKRYAPRIQQLLPVDLRGFHRHRAGSWPTHRLPTFTMDRQSLLSRLLHQHLFVSLFRACAESQASEHAARLDAMQSAQRSIEARMEDVTMAFRRARQDVITAELLDVVSGFQAVSDEET